MNPPNPHPSSPPVAGIILAAGESRRMGRDKALLRLGDETFLEHLLHLLEGKLLPLVVVLGHHASEIERQIGSLRAAGGQGNENGAEIVVLRNPDYALGQLSSLQVALRHLMNSPASGALVALVDHPGITGSVVDQMLKRFEKSGAPILIPTYRGRRGHPVLFARALFQELLEAPLDEGARFVVRQHAGEVELVETEEEGILWDIDLSEDYQRLLEQNREQGSGNREQ